MNAAFFPNWSNVLTTSGLHPSKIHSHPIAIRWYLSHLKEIRQPATVETACGFVETAAGQRESEPWMVESWQAGIRGFFE